MVASLPSPGLVLSQETVQAQAFKAYSSPLTFAEYVTEATGAIVNDLPETLLVNLYLEEVLNHIKATLVQEVLSGADAAFALAPSAYDRLEQRVVTNECFLNFVKASEATVFGAKVELNPMFGNLITYPHLENSGRYDLQKAVCSAIINGLLMSRFLRSLEEGNLTEAQQAFLPDCNRAVFYWCEGLTDAFR